MAGEGKLVYDGFNLNNSPYYAHMTPDTKYPWLDGWKVEQISVGNKLINSKAYLESFEFPVTLRIQPPDQSRRTMNASLHALGELLDPERGEKRLVIDEFPASYLIAKPISMEITDESNYLTWVNVVFGCTGPSYALTESVYNESVMGAYTFVADTQKIAAPRFRFTSTGAFTGDVVITNAPYSESVTWTGTLANGDVLDFILDEEYGTPYSVMKNGVNVLATAKGPAWPFIHPGINEIRIQGPSSGHFEIRWRSRYNTGLQEDTVLPEALLKSASFNSTQVNDTTPALYSQEFILSGTLKNSSGTNLVGQMVYLHQSFDNQKWALAEGFAPRNPTSVPSNGYYQFSKTFTDPGTLYFRTYFAGNSQYLDSYSPVSTIEISDQRLAMAGNIDRDGTGDVITGNSVHFYGWIWTVNPHPEISLANQKVVLHRTRPPYEEWWNILAEVYTDSGGRWDYWYTDTMGERKYRAYFGGTNTLLYCFSDEMYIKYI